MFKTYGFIIKTKHRLGAREIIFEKYCPEIALTYLGLDEIGSQIYFVNENTLTTLKEEGLQQVVGIWESENVLFLDLDISGGIDENR